MFFVLVSNRRDLMPAYSLELLHKVIQLIHDFCGGLDEEFLRTNFILVYEIIDELVDYGHVQVA